jgi:2'-5' RNA ligase
MPDDAALRLFIAFDLPAAAKDALAALQAAWQRASGAAQAVKWVAVPSIHLTLKFLGSTPPAQVDLIRLALGEAMAGTRPLTVRLAAPGVFPSPQRARVLWVGLAGELDALVAAQQRVERALGPLGFPPEERRFTPHLTLGRVRENASPDERRALGAAAARLRVPDAPLIALDVVHVMRSELRPSGARYTSLAQIPLRG